MKTNQELKKITIIIIVYFFGKLVGSATLTWDLK